MSGACATRACELALAALALATAGAGCSASDDVPAPVLSTVQPDHAPPGAVVTLHGQYLCQHPDPGSGDQDPICNSVGTVNFGAAPGTATTWTDSTISAEVPAAVAGLVDLSISIDGRTSNSIHFTVDN
jgi:IPT/TIG domain-containing protein